MKKFKSFVIICIVLIGSTKSKSQINQLITIKYNCILNQEEKIGILEYANNESQFTYILESSKPKAEFIENENEYGEPEVSIILNKNDSNAGKFYIDFINKKMISRQTTFIDGRLTSYIVNEPLSVIEWKLMKDTKKIGEYECQRAQAKFRGRLYYVWFTTEIAANIGPWKLNGLPGLILAVYEDSGAAYFQAESIVISDTASLNICPPIGQNNISLKEFISIRNNIGNEFEKYIQSKLPRDANFSITNIEHNWLETEFDF